MDRLNCNKTIKTVSIIAFDFCVPWFYTTEGLKMDLYIELKSSILSKNTGSGLFNKQFVKILREIRNEFVEFKFGQWNK